MNSHEAKSIPPIDPQSRHSAYYLVVVKTPSALHYEIARYCDLYIKYRPWRTVTNHGVEIILYYDLPELPNDTNRFRSA